jgi:hypothetical protein
MHKDKSNDDYNNNYYDNYDLHYNLKDEFRNSANVEHEMLYRASNYWGHGNCK